MLSNLIELIMKGGEVERFHTEPTIRRHTVGHHSFEVAMFAWLLARKASGNNSVSARLLLAALTHDLAEAEMGDIPSPAKRKRSAEWRDELKLAEAHHDTTIGIDFYLSEGERRALKLADIYAGMLTCIKERRMGNQTIVGAFCNYSSYAGQLHIADGTEREIYNYLCNQWRQAHGS